MNNAQILANVHRSIIYNIGNRIRELQFSNLYKQSEHIFREVEYVSDRSVILKIISEARIRIRCLSKSRSLIDYSAPVELCKRPP